MAFTNQKGGVGKTSTVAGIAAALDRKGLCVLCVDLDPQADLTTWLGLDPLQANALNINDVIYAAEPGGASSALQPAAWGTRLTCISSTLDLAERETDLTAGAEFRLATALSGLDGFDVVLIDCPPSIGRLVVLGLVAATHVVVVTEPSAASLRGVENVLQTIGVVQSHYNKALQLAGIVINHEARTTESRLRVEELAEAYGSSVWEPHVPARTLISQAMGASAPLLDFGKEATALLDTYDRLADRVVELSVARTAS